MFLHISPWYQVYTCSLLIPVFFSQSLSVLVDFFTFFLFFSFFLCSRCLFL
jgi:hypothetical protein